LNKPPVVFIGFYNFDVLGISKGVSFEGFIKLDGLPKRGFVKSSFTFDADGLPKSPYDCC
jgi:hypothetical protein